MKEQVEKFRSSLIKGNTSESFDVARKLCADEEKGAEAAGQIGKALKGKETADEVLQAFKLLSPGTQKIIKEAIDKQKGASGGK